MIKNVKQFLLELLNREDLTLNAYEAREQLKILLVALNVKVNSVKIQDPRIGSWLLDPEMNLNWHQMIEKFIPNRLEILELATKHFKVNSLGLDHVSSVEPKIRTAVESFLTNALLENQNLETVGNGTLLRYSRNLEMPIQKELLKMEILGFPINFKKLQQAIENAVDLQRHLELHIYKLNGFKFNLSSSKEVSKVVGIHRNREIKKVSTAKNVLEKLDLPIAKCIMSWRTLKTTISNMQPMMKLVKNSRIFGTSFSLTQTGRISMYEPNLQNVTKDFAVDLGGEYN